MQKRRETERDGGWGVNEERKNSKKRRGEVNLGEGQSCREEKGEKEKWRVRRERELTHELVS